MNNLTHISSGLTFLYIIAGICILSDHSVSSIDHYVIFSIFFSIIRPKSTTRLKSIINPSCAIATLLFHILLELGMALWGWIALTHANPPPPITVSAFVGFSCALQTCFTLGYIVFPFLSAYRDRQKRCNNNKEQQYTLTPLATTAIRNTEVNIDMEEL